MSKIHSTIGVYVGAQKRSHWNFNGVREENLEAHIEYNKRWRFGRGLFVDGKCVNKGYLSEEDVERLEKEMAENPHIPTRDTAPYN